MDECLQQFLVYGRQLTIDEQDTWTRINEDQSASFAKEFIPKLDDFKAQVFLKPIRLPFLSKI